MEIINNKKEINLIISHDFNSKLDLGWEDNFKEYENDVIKKVINPLENYEMHLFNFNPYLLNSSYLINDLHIKFFFLKTTYQNNFNNIGFLNKDIYSNSDYFNKSFFRIEYYKTENNALPTKINRRLVSTKIINLTDGELYLDNTIKEMIHLPYYITSTSKNKSINNFYWFQDNTVLNNSNLDYENFWITAKFFNAKDGLIYDFTNKITQNEIDETNDIYFKMVLNDNYTYSILNFNDNLIGTKQQPLIFYQKNG
jgi:hypothetical protein